MIDFLKKINFDKLSEKGKHLGIAAVCFLAVFIAGFGTGRVSGGEKSLAPTKRSLNNNTNQAASTKTTANTNTTNPTNNNSKAASKSPGTAAVDPANCYIKGSKSKIYHMPGGSFYDRTNPAQCFNSEEEAMAAGFTKSSR